jgi:UDP-glucose 4-epimerase
MLDTTEAPSQVRDKLREFALLKDDGPVRKERLKEFLEHPHFEFFQEDVRNAQAIESLARNATILVHLAAFKIPRYGDAYNTLTINVHGTESVLKAAVKRKARVVVASTSDVYGKNPHLPFAETHDLYMGESTVKRWAYAVSKILDEHYCLAYQEEYEIPVTILRFLGGYGPRQNTTWWGGPQSVFIHAALTDQPMEIHGDGLQTRSFTYIDDTIDGIIRAQSLPGLMEPADVLKLPKS